MFQYQTFDVVGPLMMSYSKVKQRLPTATPLLDVPTTAMPR